MNLLRVVCLSFCVLLSARAELNPAALPTVGHQELKILSPTLLELGFVTTKEPDPAFPAEWNFVGNNFALTLPLPEAFRVQAGARSISVARVGFKRRPLYAPLRKRDLRIGNWLYLELASPLNEGESVEVANPAGNLWPAANTPFKAAMTALRFNPALHVNQAGYMPGDTKKGFVGYYLGTLGELPITAGSFRIVASSSGQSVFQGTLKKRPDAGYTYSPAPYQQVFEADFSGISAPGEYRLEVPGMGVSFPFLIHSGTAALFARSYALGLYHQRCGASNSLPHTRHEHGVCHSAPAAVPDATFATANYQLSAMSHDFANNPRHVAPQLKSVDSSLYPFVNRGLVDVSGGHHDAGDYSKYTINSAGLIHHLVFAADSLGAGSLDNLGLPESGDGKSDLLQEAKWEADFLAKMQDADGGFYFLVYPRNRAYEDDVLPDRGDPQVVFPKTTAATAAAVGALAEIGSSPRFKEQFPTEAAQYLAKARLGWTFLMQAIARHGKDGAYQKITHYGNEFMHDDELAWAAAALFAATGEAQYHAKLLEFFPDPNLKTTRRWDWWRLFEGYGCAVRAYAFAARSGRLAAAQMQPEYLAKCEAEIVAAGDDIARFAEQTAYGTSFPDPSKAYRSAGWYFSLERAFEMATAHRLRPQARYIDAILSNAAYEAGCNPLNMSYITGVGWTRWRDIVHQYALNDTRVLPPSGLPLGNIQGGFAYLENYKQELGKLCYPPDGASTAPYPFYDRFGDSFNTTTEFVVVDQARGLATLSFMLARAGDDGKSPSKGVMGRIVGLPATIPAGEWITAGLEADGVSLADARITWETADQEPHIGPAFTFAPKNSGEQWIEAEALLPDGRRVLATNKFTASFPVNVAPNSHKSAPGPVIADVVALYRFDQNLNDAAGRAPALSLSGRARIDTMNLGWMQARSGGAIRFDDLGDKAAVSIPSSWLFTNGVTTEIVLEAMVYVHKHKAWNRGRANMLTLTKGWNASLEYIEDIYAGAMLRGGTAFGVSSALLAAEMPVQTWHHLSVSIATNGYSARVNGKLIASAPSTELAGWGNGTASLEIGNFEGWLDEVTIRSRSAATAQANSPVAARFLGANTKRQGSWKGLIGREGHIVSGDTPAVPAYAKVSYRNKQDWVWEKTSSESRALQRAFGNGRLLATMYSFSWFEVKVEITDGLAHRVALYCLDSTRSQRAQRIEVLDAASGKVLHSLEASNYSEGVYFEYEVRGSVSFRVTNTGPSSAVLAGVFFDAATLPPVEPSSAVFLGVNNDRDGTWKGVIGGQGWHIPSDSESMPVGASISFVNAIPWIWQSTSTDQRAVERHASPTRFLPALYSFDWFGTRLDFPDASVHKVSIYCLDATATGRAQRIDVYDALTNTLLHSHNLANFAGGTHLEYAVRGRVLFRFTPTVSSSSVISGIFIDPY